jgi:hypothetical protein
MKLRYSRAIGRIIGEEIKEESGIGGGKRRRW